MKKGYILIFVLILVSTNQAFGHKLISHDDSHRDFESALFIPDHKISWAIYENLGTNEAKYYTFDAKKGDSFYASIVIPKIQGLEYYSPTINFIDPDQDENKFLVNKVLYEGDYPGNEFYEPFGQVTYWERQEVTLEIPHDGEYFLVVADEKNQKGKYSLAIGTIEDFSGENMFLILPQSWWDTKIFVNDYTSIFILFAIVIMIFSIISFAIIRKIKHKAQANNFKNSA